MPWVSVDPLSGGAGADDLVIGAHGSGVALIFDFGPSDRCDARNAVTGFCGSDDPDDFVRFAVVAGDMRTLVDVNGSGSDFLQVMALDNVTGLNVTQLFESYRLLLE